MRKLIGVIGSGYIGRDPFDRTAWSGSSYYFFKSCQRHGILQRAFGVEVPKLERYLIMAKNFKPSKKDWARNFNLDSCYYKKLTNQIKKNIQRGDENCNFMQIGGIYNTKQCIDFNAKCFLYTDGNLMQFINSPYFDYRIPQKKLKKTYNYEKSVYDSMNLIFTMSEFLRQSFINDFEVPSEKVITIGAGINLDELPEYVEKRYDKKKIVFIGIDFVRKGGYLLLEAFQNVRKKYPEAELDIIGPALDSVRADLSLKTNVNFHGRLNKTNPNHLAKFNSIISEASLFVMPSLYEPFGIAPLEAMAYKTPCLLPNNWAFPEMVKPGWNGDLFNQGDIKDLELKITYYLSKENELFEMGKNAKEFVKKHYTWDAVIEKMKKFLIEY